ncbi:MAG: DHA2 family efflux MFS transporter permease subunit [Candidatus Saganbacteria bacterium]|nr:DHA2 family efflux MFS transporter permease subunit [Candidatus Saganbacteria bacterium]
MSDTSTSPYPNYKWMVMAIVMIGMIMSMLDSSIVNVSIPAIMADFGSNIADIEWVVTAYMLAFAVLMPLTAWLRDRVGHKLLYTASLGIFILGSLLCGLAVNIPTLISARVLQALGGGAMTPTGMAMIAEVFGPEERGRAMGFFGMGIIIGPAIGPTLGGFLTATFGWRSIFLVNLPIGIFAMLIAMEMLVHDRPHASNKRSFDAWGFVFLTIFLLSFLLGISRGETEGWTSRYIMICAVLSVFSFISFIITETLVRERIMDLSLFKYPIFTVSMLITAIRSVALFGGIFLLPLFLQQLKGLTAIQSGLVLLPGSLIIAFALPIVGWLSDKSSPRFLSLIGMICLIYSMYLYRNISIYMSYWDIIYPTLIRGVGMSLLMAPIMALALNSVPRKKAGMASSMLSVIQQVGGAIGIAILSTVLDNRTKFHMYTAGSMISGTSPTFVTVVRGLSSRAHELGLSQANSIMAAKSAVMKYFYIAQTSFAFQDAFVFAMVLIVLSLVPVFLLPKRPLTAHPEDIVPKGVVLVD